MSSIVCLVSGGMDSATLLYKARAIHGLQVSAIAFDYGQRHKKELDYARNICDSIEVPLDVIDISAITPYIAGSALTSEIPVPNGHYTASNMAATVVPNRNAIMLTIAFGLAVHKNTEIVAAAMHTGDHAIYPDCRPEFVESFNLMQRTAVQGYGHPELRLWTPFIQHTKADIALEGHSLGVNFSQTWSCYNGRENHCGTCGTCHERREAFQQAHLEDPTHYE
jgi:7-cyano-7-deazaguanine synthase